MDPWYRVVTPRKEVREGRSFNPDEFAIALEQVVAGTAPEDYSNPEKFFSRTCWTRALKDHAGMVLKRLAGESQGTAPVLTLITQFGGGKTHTLTTLYHLVRNGKKAKEYPGVSGVLQETGLASVPEGKVAVFVGNAWDPQDGRETPWIDVARQLAGDAGVASLGAAAKTTPPGTDSIRKLFEKAGGPVVILFDEVLNFLNRHRGMAESFYAFFDNINRATTGTTHCAAVMSLPRSQIEMTDWDQQWQDRINKVVHRIGKDLIANDESEISEVVCRRLFEDLGSDRVRKNVARVYADWCFERRAQLPPEWTAVDTAVTEAKAREFLRNRFETCYPFHPGTLSVFQRKWQALSQYQQTRGTLAMLAQWVSLAFQTGYRKARTEPLITLGSAPLDVREFRDVILGQLGEPRLAPAIEVDIAGTHSHARVLDADTKGPLKDIHRRVGSAILFESSGGQVNKVAHLPELRFALGEPELDTTSVDSAARNLESKAFFISPVGSDGLKIYHKATIRKAVSDRRASLDEPTEIKPVTHGMVRKEWEKGASVPISYFPPDGAEIQDSPKLMLAVMPPELEWSGSGSLREKIGEWSKQRGTSPRLYPGSIVWCLKKPGRDLREKVELMLAWKKVAKEVSDGTLGADYDRADKAEIHAKVSDAEEAAKDEVWGGYRYVVLTDTREPDGLKVIDLGAGHSSGAETLCGRVIAALKSNALLNESVGAGYLDRNWPPALKESGAWPLSSLRQSFLNGSLTRLLDPDSILKGKIVEFVGKGEFGLASGSKPDLPAVPSAAQAGGTYERVWFEELISPDEVSFEANVFLLTKAKAKALKTKAKTEPIVEPEPRKPEPSEGEEPDPRQPPEPTSQTVSLRITGTVPPEMWNRLGTRIIPKLRSASDLRVGVDFSVSVDAKLAPSFENDLRQALEDLGLLGQVKIDKTNS
jgi:hypothetical protein